MPIYEFICQACHKRSSHFVRSINQSFSPVCPACGGKELTRAISTFAHHKSIKTIHEESGEPSVSAPWEFYKDPRNIGRMTEKRFQDMGIDMPDNVKQTIQAAREGELPKELKDLS
jgi:putative FmdB family regulatory protein